MLKKKPNHKPYADINSFGENCHEIITIYYERMKDIISLYNENIKSPHEFTRNNAVLAYQGRVKQLDQEMFRMLLAENQKYENLYVEECKLPESLLKLIQ